MIILFIAYFMALWILKMKTVLLYALTLGLSRMNDMNVNGLRLNELGKHKRLIFQRVQKLGWFWEIFEKCYRWTGLQGRSWDTDVENKSMDTKGGKRWWGGDGGVMNWAIGIDMYTLMCIKLMTNKNLQYKKQTNKQKTTNTKLSLGYLYGNMLI